MKFRRARLEDQARIETAWRSIFSHDDGGHSDFYFKHSYQSLQSYLWCTDEDELVSACQVHTKTLVLNGKPLQVSLVVGVFTLPAYRKQGHMKALLTRVLDLYAHRDLFTLIQAYNPQLYLEYGFEPIYHQRVLTLLPDQIPVSSPQGVTSTFSVEELKSLYDQFTAHFTGTCRRSLSDFTLLQHEIAAQKGKILAVRSNQGLEGYATILFDHDKLVLEELVYLNASALIKLLNAVTSLNLPIEIHVSAKEDLRKLFPQADSELRPYTFAKLNDARLFNELYKVNAKSATDAFAIAKKPLWLRENQ